MAITTSITGSSIEAYASQNIDNSTNHCDARRYTLLLGNLPQAGNSVVSLRIEKVIKLQKASDKSLGQVPQRSSFQAPKTTLRGVKAHLDAASHRLDMILELGGDPKLAEKLLEQHARLRRQYEKVVTASQTIGWRWIFSPRFRSKLQDLQEDGKHIYREIETASDTAQEMNRMKKVQKSKQRKASTHPLASTN
ncbi:hypothetical protein BDN71DRAFT_1438537 [Pleurotus eryngii]|uniref:Uncharacterized protein n=1 Tax=Pleurotus eryngii TaxID=5323 RepID=A0A9P6A9N4_PLEER|nr:hypothetical protein BDN71DRAFT_1438537 [Pleurotus eryngii]